MEAALQHATECSNGPIHIQWTCEVCGRQESFELSGEYAIMAADVVSRMERICSRCHMERLRKEEVISRLDDIIQAAGVPAEFTHWDKKLGNNSLLRFCFDSLGKWVFLADEVDKGKTRAVCRAIREFYRRNPMKKAAYRNLNELAEQFTAAASQRYYYGNAIQKELESVDFLILDDLGKKGRYSEAVTSLLYDLANAMYTRGGTLWIVANRRFSYCPEFFADHEVFEAIYSRFGRMKNAGRYAGWNFGEVES